MIEVNRVISATEGAIKDYEQLLRDVDALQVELTDIQDMYQKYVELLEVYEETRIFLQELTEVTRHEVAAGLEQIVTLCLQSVFGDTLSFEIEIKTARNNPAVEFFVIDSEGEEEPVRDQPEESMGGGVVDTVAIGLRYGLLKVLNPEPVGPILLDEPAKMVSGDLVASIAALIQELSVMFGKQCIIVTHHENIMNVSDRSFYVEKVDGISKIV